MPTFGLLTPAALLLLCVSALNTQHNAARAQLATLAARHEALLATRRHTSNALPPPPEGTTTPGDAFDAVIEASTPLSSATSRLIAVLRAQLDAGYKVSEEHITLLDEHAFAIDAFRVSSRKPSVRPAHPGEGPGGEASCRPVVEASVLALARLERAPSDRCLTMAVDMFHIAHAVAARGDAPASQCAASIARMTTPVSGRCIARSTPEGLSRGRASLDALIATPAPLGLALEHNALSLLQFQLPQALRGPALHQRAALYVRRAFGVPPRFQTNHAVDEVSPIAAEVNARLTFAERARALTSEDVRVTLDEALALDQAISRGMPVGDPMTAGDRYVLRAHGDLAARGKLIATAAHTRELEMTLGMDLDRAFATASADPGRRDPYSGKPFMLKAHTATAPAAIFSPGFDDGTNTDREIVVELADGHSLRHTATKAGERPGHR